MKMRRSLWRKLIVLLFAILTAVSAFLAVRNTIPVIATSGIVVEGEPLVETVKDPEDETSYLTTVKVILKNDSSSGIKLRSTIVTVSDGSSSKDLDSIPILVSTIASGKTYEVSKTYSTKRNYNKVSRVTIETSGNLLDVVYGEKPAAKFPNYVKALIAISVILFGVFVYTCVLLYKSPKKKVHSKHKHHHHHHHHSSSSQSESSETIQK